MAFLFTRSVREGPMNFKRVLIVDDDRDFAESVAELLENRDLFVEMALSGENAVDRVNRNPFDIVLMDIGMPDMNGMATLAEMKKIQPGIQVILMTGLRMGQVLMLAFHAGMRSIVDRTAAVDNIISILYQLQPEGVILIIDGEMEGMKEIRSVADREGFMIKTVPTRQEAFAYLGKNPVKLVVANHRRTGFGGMDEFETIMKKGEAAPVLFITGGEEEGMPPHRLFAVQDILFKPFDPCEILKLIGEKN